MRPLRSRKDLAAVADLVELCFADSMDADGRDYLRHMRRIAQESYPFGDGGGSLASDRLPVRGYIWEENNRIVGNMTLISFMGRDSRIYLIANVAVHPDYRRQGIAKKLTIKGLEHARQHGAQAVWLHVRDDNQAAQDLYRQIGFIERARRSTWQSVPALPTFDYQLPRDISISPPRARDWECISRWLDQNYPAEVTWNFRLKKEKFKPGFFQEFWRYMKGERQFHLAARKQGHLIGSLIWEPTNLYADVLWIATDQKDEEEAIYHLLASVRRWAASSRPLAVNFPAGRAVSSFEKSDFSLQNTLIWMEYPNIPAKGGRTK